MKLFVFGLGFSAGYFAKRRQALGDSVAGTVRTRAKADALAAAGLRTFVFGPEGRDEAIDAELAACEALLISVPPDADGDPVLRAFAPQLAAAASLRWIGYLSTIGVYGDHGGAWIDETTPATPTNPRSQERVDAENQWLAFGAAHGVPVQVFRLAGIYGPGQNQLVQLARGTARRIVKPGQVFNRIHVEDIARVLDASLEKPRAGARRGGIRREAVRHRTAAGDQTGRCRPAADGDVVLRGMQARAEPPAARRARRHAGLSDLPRGAGRAACGRRRPALILFQSQQQAGTSGSILPKPAAAC